MVIFGLRINIIYISCENSWLIKQLVYGEIRKFWSMCNVDSFNNDFKYYNKWNIDIFKGKEKINYIISYIKRNWNDELIEIYLIDNCIINLFPEDFKDKL